MTTPRPADPRRIRAATRGDRFGHREATVARVLIVDDAAFQRMRLRRALEDDGHAVVEASSGFEAVEAYERELPDAVFLDITMAGMDGLEALRRIRSAHGDARIVMLSALAQQSTVLQAVRDGARDFLVKPAAPERVLAALHKVLA
jgi:two-component system, chemotaxis family, chemotaxis protein CheY